MILEIRHPRRVGAAMGSAYRQRGHLIGLTLHGRFADGTEQAARRIVGANRSRSPGTPEQLTRKLFRGENVRHDNRLEG